MSKPVWGTTKAPFKLQASRFELRKLGRRDATIHEARPAEFEAHRTIPRSSKKNLLDKLFLFQEKKKVGKGIDKTIIDLPREVLPEKHREPDENGHRGSVNLFTRRGALEAVIDKVAANHPGECAGARVSNSLSWSLKGSRADAGMGKIRENSHTF